MRVNLMDAYLGLICLFPIVTTAGGGWLNKGMFLLLLLLHVILFFSRPVRKDTLTALVLLVGNYAFMLSRTDFPLHNYNLLAYFPFFLLYMYFVCDHRERILLWFFKHLRYLLTVIACWCLLVAVSAFLPGSYQVREGGSLYFGSFCKDIFRLGPSAVFIQILILAVMTLHRKRGVMGFMAVPMYCYLMGSSRTYLFIGVLLFAIGWYLLCRGKALFWLTVLPLGGCLLFLIMVSAMGNKIAYTLSEDQYGDFWYRISSSRSYLWVQYWKAWLRQPLLCKLFGSHLEFTLQTAGRWAHNDFLEILCSFGLLGTAQYLLAVKRLFQKGWNRRVPLALRLSAVMVWLFNALFNMHYVYFCAMLAYPFLVFCLGWQYGRDTR